MVTAVERGPDYAESLTRGLIGGVAKVLGYPGHQKDTFPKT